MSDWVNAPGAPVEYADAEWVFVDATGLTTAYVQTTERDDPWPALVRFECDDSSGLLPDDARALGNALHAAADLADQRNEDRA